MFLEIFKTFIAVFLLGIVIKLLDDEVDGDKVLKAVYSSIYKDISAYKLPYSLLFVSLTMLLQPHLVFSLFTSAYMIGMFDFPNKKLPLKLKSYQEIGIIIVLNLFLIPLEIFFLSFTIILLIQLIDDLLDYKYDFKYGYKNYVNKFGKGEIIITSCILLLLCLILSWINTIIILSSNFFINYLYARI
ncbi:hypothetical protein [Natronincola ferrireducens]|uniref:Uncharacterized protein n=1 Tax=Natronincola ferrireducens TaxID=393762 RepID=A0A1G9CCF1_9FIRM|nr:hypothetical protein [Natronincola ferrireducens]SDK49337.1 hypothetical protein SAMN05660472_01426 [Natronincola ferrireducens]